MGSLKLNKEKFLSYFKSKIIETNNPELSNKYIINN